MSIAKSTSRTLATFVTCTVAVTGLMTPSAVAVEAERTSATSTSAAERVHNQAAVDSAKEILESHVERSATDGTFTLNAPPDALEQVDPVALATIDDAMTYVNSMILNGELRSTDDLRAFPATLSTPEVEPFHHGVNDLECSWVNCTLRLDRSGTDNLLGALQAGAGTAGVTAAICSVFVVCSIPAGVVAGVMAMGAGTIQICANSHGVWIRIGAGSWCGGQ